MNTSTILLLALSLVLSHGPEAVTHAFTPPDDWVRAVCAKTGADPATALDKRDEQATAWTAFIEDLADLHESGDADVEMGIDTGEHEAVLAKTGDIPNLYGVGLMLYRAFGKDFLTRALTAPEGVVEAICERSGADEAEALSARNAAVSDTVAFIEELAGADLAAISA